MLNLENIHVSYSGSAALRGVDLSVNAGEVATVIGPNGAGKTTLLRTISGIVRRQQGTVRFNGEDIGRLSAEQIVRRGIIHVPEGRMVLGRMTVRDNLLLGGYAHGQDVTGTGEMAHVLSLFPRLRERFDQLAGTLSGGEQQMVAIGRGLLGRPKLLMLDEPSLGLAPLVVEQIFDVISEIRRAGITVLLVEQNASKALRAGDQGYVLDLGIVAAQGSAKILLNDARVRSTYLGV